MKFKKIYIEITNICNLSCSFCSIDNHQKKMMSLEEFEHILKSINDYTDYVYLHVKGEPLLHQHLDEILKLCTKYNKKVNITTNGTILKENLSVLKRNKCLNQLNISLHSENNKEHYLDDIFESVEQLKEDIPVVYRFWTLENYEFNEKIKKIVKKITDYYQLDDEIIDKIYHDSNIKISNNLYVNKSNMFEWPDLSNNYYSENGYCQALKTHLAILVDGTVIPCCLDSDGVIKLGNIFKNSMTDILNSEKVKNIRTSFNNRQASEELCKHCSFKEKFDKIAKK